ncbi:MAG: carbamate kinase [Coriobacteriia bacterium]|nr:carbamate kinase [Coriobacteriia bacterium]
MSAALTDPVGRTIVVALGGNAMARATDTPGIESQFQRADEAMAHVAGLVAEGARVVLTHGNGPVVGDILMRGEAACELVPPMPLFIADADSEGGIGLMLQQVLGNRLRLRGVVVPIATVVTQVVVAENDPAFMKPTKPIGPYFQKDEAHLLADERGWRIAEEPGRGWRRVVASPRPRRIIETPAVRALVNAGVVAIAAGGGGVPVVEDEDGLLRGVDAVIDKDWASAVLAAEISAEAFVILMEADAVYDGWGTEAQQRLDRITPSQASALLASGALPAGSIGPKVAAASWFAEKTGNDALICRGEDLTAALSGRAGTRFCAR